VSVGNAVPRPPFSQHRGSQGVLKNAFAGVAGNLFLNLKDSSGYLFFLFQANSALALSLFVSFVQPWVT
jgi:hypothetical protein